ncbi:MAG TPA: Calx-beta domain-containing protein, partial [Verrucomicrobiae bacterium]
YWLEYRRQYTSNPWLQNGLLIDWTPWDFSNGGAQLVDTTPGSPNPGDTASRDDAAVVIGRTYADANNGVYITPVQRSQSGGEPWIDYQVNTGWFTNNRPPTVQIESEQSVLGAYPLVHFHAVAADPDGDTLAYAWSFDDLTFATNNQPWSSKQYSDAKEHVVRCIVSDMKGGEASANLVVTNAAATGYRLTGRVTDQSGQPIQGMLVGNGLVAASTFVGGWTDSDGRYVIVNVAAGSSLTLQPACYGYTFSNANWSNPYQPTNSTEGLDFVLTPLTRITITADTNTVPESDGSTHFFTITRQGDTNSDLQVNLGLLGESCTATPDVDFKILPDIGGTNNYLIIPAGSNQLTVAVNVVNDNLVEGPEDITLTLLSDTNLVNQAYVLGAPAEATITIQDDDAPVKPVVTVATATPVVEENGFDNGQWIFTRTGAPTGDLLVNYTITGTATAGSDYVPLAGVVLIPAGQSSVSLPLQVRDDKNVEADETVVLTLASSAAYTSGNPAAATITILDDDFMTVTVVPTGTAAEPSTPGSFTIKRDGDLTEALVVTYTVAGTAAPGVDYTALSGTATIPAGSASTVVPVMPSDDTLLEGQETVVVTLTSGPNYDIGTPGTATVLLNDNELPTLGITAAGSPVSEQGDATAHFTITRNGTSGNLTVPLQISGTATPGADYLPLDNPVIIPDGSASVTLDVIPFHDTILEPDETVVVTLPTGTNYNLGGAATASVVITDDATSQIPGVGFCFAASAWPEYQSPGIAVVLSTNLGQAVQVSYHVLPGSTAAPSRYALPDGVLTIPANSLVGFIPLAIIPNQVVDPPQNVKVVLFNPINATLDAIKVHTYTILDANAGSVSVTAITNTAAEAGPVSGAFRIARTGAATNAQVVNFQVTGTASAPSDYAPLGSSVIIPAGSNYVDLPVIPNHDGSQEPAQTVVLTLTSATNAAITSPNVATVTINDIDLNTLPIITLLTNHPYAYESGGDGSFDFYLAAPLTNNLTVNFVLGGTAGNGTDYLLVSNSVVIPAGQTNVSVLITPVDDGLVEGDETVVLSLVEATNYRVAYPGTATVIIQDNDQKIWVDASDFAAAKYSPTGIDPGQFTFTRFGTTNQAVTIYYAISGTASNGWDYVKITNNVVIPAGSWSATVPILPRHTGQIIGPVTATVTLLTNAAYALGSPTNATVLISDDMPGVSIFAVVTNVLEGSGSNGIFRVVRSGDPQYTFAPRLRVGGTATYGVDYPPFSTNLYFTCGQVSVDLYVNPTNEMVVEPDEVVQATLLPGAGYSLLSPTNAALTINDAGTNQTPQVQIISPAHGFAFLDGTNAGLVLNAVVTDDSTNDSLTWSKISGPDAYVFGNPTNNPTTVLFTNAGIYRLRLTADDGQLQGHADLIVFVGQATAGATNALHWSFNEGTGTNVLDDSGQGRNGLFNGTPVWLTNGIAAGALNFHGTNDSVRQTAGANTLNGLAAMTVSLWIRPPATNTSQGFLTGDDSGTNGTFNLGTQWVSGCGDATNVIDATLATPLGLFHRTTAGGTVTTGAWEHVALTWSNSTAPKIFINGKMDQANAGFVPVLGALTNCPQFVAGRGGWGSPA